MAQLGVVLALMAAEDAAARRWEEERAFQAWHRRPDALPDATPPTGGPPLVAPRRSGLLRIADRLTQRVAPLRR
jgi:hypothetical protein